MGRAMIELADAHAGVERAALPAWSFDPRRTGTETEERLFAIRAMARKHGVGCPMIWRGFADTLRARALPRWTAATRDLAALTAAEAAGCGRL
jgi:DNA repair protein RecN (Recombination protein N)